MVTIKIKSKFKRQMYELDSWSKSQLLCGIDEVGRSCFAGPVVAAAAILRPHVKHKLLKDSKLLTPEERLKVYNWLQKNSQFAVGIIDNRIIDKVNIYHATMYAMKKAVMQLLSSVSQKPSLIVIDAMPLKFDNIDIPVVCFNYGERQSASIAAASIIAKVTRDNLMTRMDRVFPGYVFSSNKGYGTKVHREAIEHYGSTIIHRKSFLKLKEDQLMNEDFQEIIDQENIKEI